jgi:hypothetical protein
MTIRHTELDHTVEAVMGSLYCSSMCARSNVVRIRFCDPTSVVKLARGRKPVRIPERQRKGKPGLQVTVLHHCGVSVNMLSGTQWLVRT